MVKLTAELIEQAAQYTNAVRDRELDLRGAGLPADKKKGGPSPGDVEAIKNAIANASTLAEVERLKGLLQSGQIPGRERRSGPTDDGEEEMEEDTVTNGS